MPSSTASTSPPQPCQKSRSFELASWPRSACSTLAAFAKPSSWLTCRNEGPGSRVPRCSG
eukprot:4160338-Pleurochrysis_carterae.AAC.1